MSFITYIKEGIGLANHAYDRFNPIYTQDQAKAITASYEYNGNVTASEITDTQSRRVLDKAIEIISVSDQMRAPKIAFWEKRSAQSLKLGIAAVGLSFAGTAAGIAAGTLLAETVAIVAVVAAVAVVVAGVALTILSLYRRSQANGQYAAWQDPLQGYQVQRRQTQFRGFSHVFENGLKGTLIHPEENRQLWINWSNSFMPLYQQIRGEHSQFPDSINKIKQFFQNNPLDAAAMKYAFEGVEPAPENIQDLSVFYNQMKSAYSFVRDEAEKARNKIKGEKRELIRNNESQREAWLAPAKFVKEMMVEQARNEKSMVTKPFEVALDNSLAEIHRRFARKEISLEEKNKLNSIARNDYHHHHLIIKSEHEYQMKVRKYQLLYELATAPINLKFDHNNNKIEKWAQKEIKKIYKKEDQKISHFAHDVQGVAQSYINMTTYNKRQEEKEQQERLYPDLELFTNLNEAYVRPPAYNPELSASEVTHFFNQISLQPQPSAPGLFD
jgi:hypothetical protein